MSEVEQKLHQLVAAETGIPVEQVKNTVRLLDEENTIPFIARYRKELTGQLDEEQIRTIFEKITYYRNLEKRKEEVIRLIAEQGKLTEELQRQIEESYKLQQVEDLYRPYRQKRKTRASVAKEKGLAPLMEEILEAKQGFQLEAAVSRFINEELGVNSAEEAIQGAMDIFAEMVADDAATRDWIRTFTQRHGKLVSALKDQTKDEKGTYQIYYEYQENLQKIPPHRTLAVNRGEKEEVLKVSIETDRSRILEYLAKKWIPKQNPNGELLRLTLEDSYKRLIEPSIEREIRNQLTEKAEEQAISVFSQNLKQLLLQPPLKGKIILGVDPAYRTGCKLAVIDETGKVLDIGVIYPTPPQKKIAEAKDFLNRWAEKYGIELIAIGNGTASRETEQFIAEWLRESQREIYYLIVNEAGASVYSASPLAKEEFPDLDVSERSAISIARRVADPLAELVKIDPKSIGVGQYQHDVTQSKLEESLQFVVESAVNQVGVNVNTASSSLLQYVSGISKSVANNIVKYREENGRFLNRKQLTKVPRMGAKTYEQAIGFLRIVDGENPLDQTPIHPESYPAVDRLLKQLGIEPSQIGTAESMDALKKADIEQLAAQIGIGIPTLRDIIDSLLKPGRDPRDELPKPMLMKDVLELDDLKVGMELQGTVRNIVDFGVFVDIGLKNDGLVHISRLSKSYVSHPLEVVSVGEIVRVWVVDIDKARERVSLSMIQPYE